MDWMVWLGKRVESFETGEGGVDGRDGWGRGVS